MLSAQTDQSLTVSTARSSCCRVRHSPRSHSHIASAFAPRAFRVGTTSSASHPIFSRNEFEMECDRMAIHESHRSSFGKGASGMYSTLAPPTDPNISSILLQWESTPFSYGKVPPQSASHPMFDLFISKVNSSKLCSVTKDASNSICSLGKRVSKNIARSSGYLAIGPTVDIGYGRSIILPAEPSASPSLASERVFSLIHSAVGLMLYKLFQPAGFRKLPIISLPSERTSIFDAIAAAAPPLLPPAVTDRLYGFRVVP
mmetsp:Transcript_4537/g.8121  ORF Transcript_4537/g.8121 Transcript_4537/m.8121 type:complete len:258 (-) Transcript_4537:453-1226(-)